MASNHETFGKYILLEKLATGGMAEVYLAKAPSVGGISKFVAIKRILPQFSDSPEFIDMFKDEAKIAINLNHSNIVSIYEFGVERKQFFLVMDYVEGRNLRQILNKLKKTTQQLNTEQVLYVVKEIASGLDNAHRCLDGSTGRPLNITHRDMSPQNVMISFEGEVKIVDFGIAKAESQLETTRAGTLKGKFGYMSPEQAEGLAVDLRTDIFSLGIVLWELLANDRLFVANNEINTLRKIRDCQIPSLRKINPNIPQELDRIVTKSLTRDRNLRYQTAAAFQKDLNKFLNRQYPDFSPHDFSVFVKTLFASEILETRKRLIDYAKVPFPTKNEKNEDSGEFTATQTDTSSVANRASSRRGAGLAPRRIQAPENFVSKSKAKVSFDSLEVDRKEIVQKTIELKQTNEKPLATELDSQDPFEISTPTAAVTLNNLPQQKTSVTSTMQTATAMASSTVNPIHTSSQQSSYNTFSGIHKLDRTAWLRKTLIIAVATLTAVYILQPSLITSVFGLRKDGATTASSKQTEPVSAEPKMGEEIPSSAEESDDPSAISLLVTSKPLGADIYVNSKKTGKATPSAIQVPNNEPFNLDVQMLGYETFSKRYVANQSGQRVEAILQKEVIGYIDISVVPANSRTIIYVNGEKLAQGPPVNNYKVQAGRRINIKAVNPYNQSEAEQLIVVDKDQTKKVSLRLRGGKRKPTGKGSRSPKTK